MAGARVSAWRCPRAEWKAARTPSWPPMAHPTWGVALSMPRISTACAPSGLDQPAVEGAAEGVVARGPGRASAPQTQHPFVVVVAQLEPHLEELGGQGADDDVAPLDEGDALVVEELSDAQVEQLLQVLEA